MLLAGTLRGRNEKVNIYKYLLDICTAIIQPIQLQFELVAARLVKKKLLQVNDITMAPNFKEVVVRIRSIEEEIIRHSRLQLGLETIFQMEANAILLFYAYSTTRARHGLSSLFERDSNFFGLSIPPEVVIGTLLAINFLSFTKVQMNGMIEGYASNYQILGKVMISIGIICATLVQTASTTLYFSTTLGLFDLLQHYQGMQYQIV